MDSPNERKRKRVPNFTAAEKLLLTKLINTRKNIIENKRTDGKMINKKKTAWAAITLEYNSNINVHKRDTATLKRAWDNLKAAIRKARALKREQLNEPVSGAPPPSPPPDPEEIMSMVEEASAPGNVYDLQDNFDSDNGPTNDNTNNEGPSITALSPIVEVKQCDDFQPATTHVNMENKNYVEKTVTPRKASDFVRREGALRLKILEEKRKIEVEMLKVQLDTRQKENLRAELLLEAAKLELEFQRKRLYQL